MKKPKKFKKEEEEDKEEDEDEEQEVEDSGKTFHGLYNYGVKDSTLWIWSLL